MFRNGSKNYFYGLVLKRLAIVLCFAQSITDGTQTVKLLGEEVTLLCLTGNSTKEEPDTITWQLDSRELLIDGTRLRQPSKLELEINSLTYADSGLYSCYVKSTFLNSTSLKVEGQPIFTDTFLPATPKNGTKLSLECAAIGHPLPLISWQKDGVQLASKASIINITSTFIGDATVSKMEIYPVTYLNNGTFSCVASNVHGSVKHQAPIHVYVGAFIIEPPQTTYVVRRGSDVTLTCRVFGNPRPSVIWYHTVNISSTRYEDEVFQDGFITRRTIKISQVIEEDSGNFTCITANSFSGVSRETSRVVVQDVPSCCRITFIGTTSRKLALQWFPYSNGNSEIKRYNITLINEHSVQDYAVSGTKTMMSFDGLSPGQRYQIFITAENAIGASNTSNAEARMLEEEYTQCILLKPSDVRATSLVLTWSRNCNVTFTGQNYLDVMVFENNKLRKLLTYKSEWENMNKSVSGLLPFTAYGFKVREIQPDHKKGFESQLLSVQSKESAPSLPRNVRAVQADSTTLEVTWDTPKSLNGIIREYELWYSYFEKDSLVQVENKKSIDAVLSPRRSFILKGLMMDTNYNVSVRERTGVGLWSDRSTISLVTREGVPAEAPQNVSVTLQNDSFVTLQWNQIPIDAINGDLIGYVIEIRDVNGDVIFNKTVAPKVVELKINTLQAHEQYNATIYGLTRIGAGKEHSFTFFTANGVPSVPRNLKAIAISSDSLTLSWTRPAKSNGIITEYQIKWRKIRNALERSKRSAVKDAEESINGTPKELIEIREHFIRNLAPYSMYSFRVRERTANGWGPFTKKIEAMTLEGEPSAPENLKVLSKTKNSITVVWEMPKNPNGVIKTFVIKCYQGTLKSTNNVTYAKNIISYKSTCVNLRSHTETMILVYAVSSMKGKATFLNTVSAAPEEAFPWLLIIGGCVGFVVVVALILTIVLICRRKTKYVEVMDNIDDVEMNSFLNSRPIHIANLKQYVLHNHTNSDHGFFTEYEAIKPSAVNLTWEYSQNPANQHKNRYSNIVAYDHTRVILSQINNDPSTTYINANYVDGYKHPRKFIATQGPIPETVNDFWRMIYEQNCQVIVMLTKIVEDFKVKCEGYWPDRGSTQYGNIIVKLIEITELSDYVVRTFSIKSVSDVEAVAREVKQYHYLGWPDHGVPEYPTSMVAFTKYVMDNAPPKPGPIVVHCSAGVGRTGTLIVIDAMMNQIREENIIDVYKFVSMIRRQRNFMVQTEAQYVFIYDALLDAVICGNTEATAHDIAAKLRYLDQQSHDTPDTYLMQEFKRLEAGLSSQEKELFSIANLPENKEKNRFLNILPYNRNRVKLAFIYGQKGSDYINASYIDGYRQRHVFIATQGPLENTVSDFWRMVWEQNCHNIVMLTKLTEKGKERSRQYWPACGSQCYGKFLVDEVRQRDDECENVVVRELNLTYTETGRTRRVYHYLYTGWPEYGSPNSGTDIIKLIAMINEMAAARGCGPVAVHCSGGAGRTGTFIALYICIQKLKTEGTVDIFQTVRQLRTQRPAMVQTIDQYYFCYQALKDYVDTTADVTKIYDMDESLA